MIFFSKSIKAKIKDMTCFHNFLYCLNYLTRNNGKRILVLSILRNTIFMMFSPLSMLLWSKNFISRLDMVTESNSLIEMSSFGLLFKT